MTLLIRAVVGVLLLAHGLVHLLYVAPDARDPRYPFTLARSRVVPEPARRPVAVVLMAATVAAFALLALAVWGVPGLASAWAPIALAAGAVSLVLLAAFWDRRLVIGVAIDVVALAIALIQPGWTDRID